LFVDLLQLVSILPSSDPISEVQTKVKAFLEGEVVTEETDIENTTTTDASMVEVVMEEVDTSMVSLVTDIENTTTTDASMVEVVMEEVNTSMVVEIDTSIDRSLVNDTLPSALSEAFPEFFGRIRMDTASRMFCATDIVMVANGQELRHASTSLSNTMMKYPDFAVLVQEGKINNKVSHRGFRPIFCFYFCPGPNRPIKNIFNFEYVFQGSITWSRV